jgi:hypothetical protein
VHGSQPHPATCGKLATRKANRLLPFGALREPLRLDLIDARRFPGGTAIHVYRPRQGNR